MRRIAYTLSFVIFALLLAMAFVRTYRAGRLEGQHRVSREILGAAAYTAAEPSATPQLREFAKAQAYYYAHQSFENPSKIPAEYFKFGPVDETLIKDLWPFIPHADTPNDYYRK